MADAIARGLALKALNDLQNLTLTVEVFENNVVLIEDVDTVGIGIEGYNANTDWLLVHSNSVFLSKDIDYLIIGTNIIKTSGLWNNGTSFNFTALRYNPSGFQFDASDISYDNSISGLIAENTQLAIDELKFEIDNVDGKTVINNTTQVITQTLYSENATVATLTVDQLDTSKKVINYLNSDIADVNYIKAYDQYYEFIEATTDGLSSTPVFDRSLNQLYWVDETNTNITTDDTGFPVLTYVYAELTKLQMAFKTIDGVYTPIITLGAGTGVDDNAKGFIFKSIDGLTMRYVATTGDVHDLVIGDNGTSISGITPTDIQMYDDGMVVTFDDNIINDFTITKNESGQITQVVNNTKNITTNITYNVGNKP